MEQARRASQSREGRRLGASRQHEILALLTRGQAVAVGEIADRLGVSQETIRRDIRALEEAGRLRRVHGGAMPSGAVDLTARRPVTERLDVARSAKQAAAEAALPLFVEGMNVFLGGSSTMLLLARALAQSSIGLSVTTNMIDIATVFAARPRCGVTLLGGVLNPATHTLVGPETLRALERRVFDLAVCGTSAIHPKHGCLGPSEWHAAIGEALATRAGRLAVVADHGKFLRSDAHQVIPLADLHAMATDKAPPDSMAEVFLAHQVTLLLPPDAAAA
jgi:DeoR/GlpR family transcriptional regulator of sugar metabolism